ncbi:MULTISPECIES: MauE/DoxX family redox-associated membrane protein [Actinoalloteichus]|uniref:Membrane protein n=1 Tax=Actinoalloteichus fjordicus TaxID=1612552 RepID=A0AAC9LH87_9PSEU|nr:MULTISPECIES: DoxX family protein [Actinoalloteichus]APU16274.1 putative membrane protein [Actinoalloteichus fjordicus]APU22334.1 putative membrane protein [Actinoalloteichus sp. GBA129-24]
MAPLIMLIAATLLGRTAGLFGVEALDERPAALRLGLAAMVLLTGLAHFVEPRRASMIAMVPPSLPRPALLATATGVLELLAVPGLLWSPTARWAAAGPAVLLVVMFPGRRLRARREVVFAGRPATPLLPRTLMQLGFLSACLVVVFG